MADKSVNELVAASRVTPTDLFVLEQNGEAKKLTGQTLENWLLEMADGKGGIQKVEKVASSGLVDTYRITFSDTSTFTYTVTNGEQGEAGEKTYLWVKYSDQNPTSNSDIYDTPDNWIGIYTGDASSPPTEYTQYAWFKIKGETGETGSAATVTGSAVTYQVGDSGTIIPSGTWLNSIPPVAQGRYLWTRTVITFNTGSPVTTYSVSRMGVDGAGSVSSVNNVSPDENGNVQLTADNVGALASDGGTMKGPVNMNGQTIMGLNEPTSNDEPATKSYADNVSKRRYASACGSASALALPQGEITPLTLDTWKANSGDVFTFADGGIVMPRSGTVLMCASVYFNNISTANPASIGPYVKHNGVEIAGQLSYSESTTAVPLSPVLAEVAEGDVLTLHARNTTRDGSCIPNAKATALTVIYL